MTTTMRAWVTDGVSGHLRQEEVPAPVVGVGDVLVQVLACGVCRTDLHVVDGDLPPHRPRVTPGHQVVGRVIATHDVGRPGGSSTSAPQVGDLVGVAWLRSTCGACRWCRTGQENLCPASQYNGWDANGGFAEQLAVPGAFVYPLPAADPVRTAPLLCAGIIGFRALTRARLPVGGTLGLYGFGLSAHITAQLALAAGAEVMAMTRGEANRQLARTLGLAWVGESQEPPPTALDSAIVFAPAGEIVPAALRAVRAGGTVVVAGIHLTDVPALDYAATLFHEKDLRSVTANTRGDGDAFLRLAARLHVGPTVTTYGFDHVDQALDDLRRGHASGSLVVTMP